MRFFFFFFGGGGLIDVPLWLYCQEVSGCKENIIRAFPAQRNTTKQLVLAKAGYTL